MSELPTDLYGRVLRFSTAPGPLLHALITTPQRRAIWSMAFPGSFQHAVLHACEHGDVKLLRRLCSRAPTWLMARVNWCRMCTYAPDTRQATTAFVINWTPCIRLLTDESMNTIACMHSLPNKSYSMYRRSQIQARKKAINARMRNERMRKCMYAGI